MEEIRSGTYSGEKGLEGLQPHDLHDHDRGRRCDRAPLDLGKQPSRGC